jgi:transcriptional regulator with XRE-family HTH domain
MAGGQLLSARRARRWSLDELASRAGVSRSAAHAAEAGRVSSLETYVRLATALGLRPSLVFEPARQPAVLTSGSTRDVVHAAMGECEARHLAALGLRVAIDEPYQHFQFAGRADVLAWDLEQRRLLHIENKSRLDDIQDVAGSYNAKRAYLAQALGERLGVGPRGWRTVSHVLAVLWSSEVLHTLRLRTATFRALCPDPADEFAAWWAARNPAEGVTSSLVILDPAQAIGRSRRWIGLDDAATARPRYRDYPDAAAALGVSRP